MASEVVGSTEARAAERVETALGLTPTVADGSATATQSAKTVEATNTDRSREAITGVDAASGSTPNEAAVKAHTLASPTPRVASVGPHNFQKLWVLGAGSIGRVYLVQSVGLEKDGFYAMKVVRKSDLVKKNREQRVLTEKEILSVASHPFIVALHFTFQTAEHYYFIMQYCAGGEFFSLLKRQDQHRLSETQARFYAAEVLLALEYLHLMGIIYRDLKPENILVHESGHIMLSDFDLAFQIKSPKPLRVSQGDAATNSSQTSPDVVRAPHCSRGNASRLRCSQPQFPMMDTESHLRDGEMRRSFVGTHEYVAPEIIAEEGYGGSVDWWAFGVLLYEMVYGKTPFRGKTKTQTLENILDITEEVEFPTDSAGETSVSDECKDLLRLLLVKDVNKRLQSPLSIKAHPFFSSIPWPLIRHQSPPIVPSLVHLLTPKEFPPKLDHAFDDEVPYAKGVISPQMARQKAKKKRVVLSNAPLSSPEARLSASATVNTSTQQRPNPMGEPHMNPPPQAPALSADISTSMPSASSIDRPGPTFIRPQSPAVEPCSSPQSLLKDGQPAVTTGNAATPSSFDYNAGPASVYWSNSESSQSLRSSLSGLLSAGP